ncbi:MAG: ATP synthase subunit C [Symbiobacteriaceae bacterium]|nr:ATP synthase subunit C [Symbiobacteriaceae bacterium]
MKRKRIFLMAHLVIVVVAVVTMMAFAMHNYAQAAEATGNEVGQVGNNSYSWAFIAAALATGIGSIGAGIAVAAAAPAAIGALAEDSSTFGKAMIFVGLGEGLAIFGLLVSILILQKIP